MADVIDGPTGGNAQAAPKDGQESFSTMTVGNTGMDQAGWHLDELLSVDKQTDPATGVATQPTLAFRRPWANRRMGAPTCVASSPSAGLPPTSASSPTAVGQVQAAAIPRATFTPFDTPVPESSSTPATSTRPMPTQMVPVADPQAPAPEPQAPTPDQPKPRRIPILRAIPSKTPGRQKTAVTPEQPAEALAQSGPPARRGFLRLLQGRGSPTLPPPPTTLEFPAVGDIRSTGPLPVTTMKVATSQSASPVQKPQARTAALLRVAEPPPETDKGPVLPVPPLDEEKYRYIRRNSWLITLLGAVSFPLLVYSQVRLMFINHWFWLYAPFVLLSVIFLALPMVTDAFSREFDFEKHRKLVAAWRPTTYPSVDLFLPVCGEPLEVLRNTWTYVARMNNHYRGGVTPYVLDDSHSPEIKAMAREFGFAYATRPNRGWFKKSGNLWFGYQVSYSDFIMLMDADFAPRHDFLDEILPYMYAYPDTAIVQTPQYFRVTDDQTWVERGGGAIQEIFYRSIQASRGDKGGAICCGSCAVYRRAAFNDHGGMTLAEVNEDMLTGFDLRKYGWRLRYIPRRPVHRQLPGQRDGLLEPAVPLVGPHRGAVFSKRFWGAKLPRYMRICYLSGLVYYVYSALFTFMAPLLAISILALAPQMLQLSGMIYTLPMLLYGAVVIPLWHHAPFRLEAWATQRVAGWAHFFTYWDAIRGTRIKWTPSGGGKQDGARRFWASFTIWTLGSSVLWAGLAFFRMVTMNPENFIVLFGLGLFELLIAIRVLLPTASGAHA